MPSGKSLVLLVLLWAAIPAAAAPPPSEPAPVTVTDFRGRTLTFPRPVSRIVCLIESALSGLYMLGAEDRVVGVSANVYQEPVFPYYARLDGRIAARTLPAPGNWDFISVERVLALKPEVVILWAQQTEAIAALESRGVPVFGVFLATLAEVAREMRELGRLTGTEARAAELLDWTGRELARVSRRLTGLRPEERPRVYFMWAQSPLETSGGTSTVRDLIELAGGRNLFAHLPQEHLRVKQEELLAANPEVIIMWHNSRLKPVDILALPAWQGLAAVQTRRVHELPPVFLCDLWTLKYVHAVKRVAAWLHPRRFADLDLAAEEKRMLQVLYRGRLEGP